MTVYPFIIQFRWFEITGYGLMMMAGFLVAGWVMQVYLRERQLNQEYAADVVVFGVIGGLIGAKLWYVAISGDPGALISRAGLVWYGGFFGAAAAIALNGWRKRVPLRFSMDLVAPAVVIGYALGRVGCFLVNDDYGVPTSLPWGMKFPEGSPPTSVASLQFNFGITPPEGANPMQILAVHPTQLYEVAAMIAIFAILWKLRNHKHAMGWLFGVYLMFAGAERFLVEFLRAKDDRLLGLFTIAQMTSIVLISLGAYLAYRWWDPTKTPNPDLKSLAVPVDQATGTKQPKAA